MSLDQNTTGLDEYFVPVTLRPKIIELREGLMGTNTKDDVGLGKVIPEIVNDIMDSGVPISPMELIPFVKNYVGIRRQRDKIQIVVKTLMNNLLDPTFEYELPLGTMVDECCYHRVNANSRDHGNFYRCIIHRLQSGSIRDYCIANGLVQYLNKILGKVKENYQFERSRGTIL